ncbi:maleylpyruvate isomerase N-terminal domain-containing protein [Actinopolymorpha sp. B17G11]|uniref:maleylpyruvate isomerase N-terminal domain-containing protein n=1 Tax=Actinopolymorpha sp. B17G11 TaxID=3160861 RepID=UPI0032E3EE84
MDKLHHRVATAALTDAYSELSRLVGSLEDTDYVRPSRCAGWAVGDVLFHLLLDAQRALVAFGTPTRKAATTDYVTYWRDWSTHRDERVAGAHARFVRVATAAYTDPQQLAGQWQQTAAAVLTTASALPGSEVVASQGRAFTVTDFLGTLAVEATVHHFDLLMELPGKPEPRPGALDLTVRVLDQLLGDTAQRPPWDDLTWVLKGTGRTPLTTSERRALGATATRFPLVG